MPLHRLVNCVYLRIQCYLESIVPVWDDHLRDDNHVLISMVVALFDTSSIWEGSSRVLGEFVLNIHGREVSTNRANVVMIHRNLSVWHTVCLCWSWWSLMSVDDYMTVPYLVRRFILCSSDSSLEIGLLCWIRVCQVLPKSVSFVWYVECHC